MMHHRTLLLALSLAASIFVSTAFAAESLADRIASLESVIEGYPPNIKSQSEADSVKKGYFEIKSELDKLLSATPDDQQLLFLRGQLKSMGHNMNLPDAWGSADQDLRKLLMLNIAHIPGLLTLAWATRLDITACTKELV